MIDSGETALGGTEGVTAVYSQVQGLDRDANLKSTSVHRRSNREGSISPSGNLSGQRDRGVTGDCYAFFVSKEGPGLRRTQKTEGEKGSMSELKRTQLYAEHVAAGATMVDFGGWEMPIEYPGKIVAEHLYTRSACSLFDVSHMGRILVDGTEAVPFLQHVLSSDAAAIAVDQAQYTIIPNERGGAVDDAYLYRFEEKRYLLVVNAANTDRDLAHLESQIGAFDARITVITGDYAAIAVQGPKSDEILQVLTGGEAVTEPKRNALRSLDFEGRSVHVAHTGYTGEPLSYEVYIRSEEAVWLWRRLIELGAKPAGLGARDTLRLEAGLPLYGREMGADPEGKEIPIFAVPLARFAVSFAEHKGDFLGREALERQWEAAQRIKSGDLSDVSALPRRILPVKLTDKGVMRAGMPVYNGARQIGFVTSGTVVPYYQFSEEGVPTEETGRHAIGLALLDSGLAAGDEVEVDVRGRRLKAAVCARHMKAEGPYARPVL